MDRKGLYRLENPQKTEVGRWIDSFDRFLLTVDWPADTIDMKSGAVAPMYFSGAVGDWFYRYDKERIANGEETSWKDLKKKLSKAFGLSEAATTLDDVIQIKQIKGESVAGFVWSIDRKLSELDPDMNDKLRVAFLTQALLPEYAVALQSNPQDYNIQSSLDVLLGVESRLKSEEVVPVAAIKHDSYEKQMFRNKKKRSNYFSGKCSFCKRFGHKKADCWHYKEKSENKPSRTQRPLN